MAGQQGPGQVVAHARVDDQPGARDGGRGCVAALGPDHRVLVAVDDEGGNPQAARSLRLSPEAMTAAR